jgi:hypothetical protein
LTGFALLLAAAGRSTSTTGAAAPQGITRKYDVQLAFTGYTGLAESQDCRALVDLQGYDSLAGSVSGIESQGPSDEEVVYRGALIRRTRLDYCLTLGRDQLTWCVAKLTGSARMDVELTVYGEADRGAYLKARPSVSPLDSVGVRGNCSPAEMDSIRVDYPSGESGGTPDGQPIAEVSPPRFVVGGVPRLRVGYFPPDSVQGGWGLRVVRAIP